MCGTAARAEGALSGLERDVVVGGRRRRAAVPPSGGREVVGRDRDVALGREAVAGPAAALEALGRGQELDVVGDDVDRLTLVAVLVLVLAPLEAPVDRDRAALRQVLGGVLALAAPDRDVEVVGLVLPVAGLVVLAARVGRDPQAADRHAAPGRAELGVSGEVAGQDDPVDVRGRHCGLLSLLNDLASDVRRGRGGKRSDARFRYAVVAGLMLRGGRA